MTKVSVNKNAGNRMAAQSPVASHADKPPGSQADIANGIAPPPSLPPGVVKDKKGRVIKVANLNALEKMRLYEFISNEKAMRDRWMGLAMMACCVRSINGEECPIPSTEREIEMMVNRLGDEGLSAAGEGLMRLNGTSDAEIERIKNS